MADHALFYNSVDHDRVYNADSFSDWLKKFFTTGVFTGDLFVSASSSMNVSVGAGYVNVNGKVMIFDAATPLTLEPANGVYPRIDTIVIERNDTDRDITLKVVTGDYANLNDPVPTPPVRSGAVYQLVLAQIYVGAGVTEITQANITDTRADSSLCGIVTGTVQEMDFSQFVAQFNAYYEEFQDTYEADFDAWSLQKRNDFSAWELAQQTAFVAWMNGEKSDFDAWFANLQYVLDGDVAGHLQNEIDAIEEGLAGSIFEIHTTNASLYGKTITMTGATQIKTAVFDANGDAEITGVTDIGNLTFTATDGVDTATTVINVPYFSKYSVSMSFWSATVSITTNCTEAYGKTITVKKGAAVIASVTFSAVGQATYVANSAGTYTFSVVVDGVTKAESTVLSTDGQTANVAINFGEIDITYDNEFRNTSIVCSDGTTTITKTAPSGGNTMKFYPPNTGNWTVSGNVGGTAYVSTPNPVVVSSLSTAVSAALQTIITKSVTMYGAANAVITWTNADGSSGTATMNSSGQNTASLKIIPSGSAITFTDTTVAKNPSDLSANYTKTVTVSSATTEVYVMPDKVLYWYGYKNNVVAITSANGWSSYYGSLNGGTFNTNSYTASAPSVGECGLASASKVNVSKAYILARSEWVAIRTTKTADYGNIADTQVMVASATLSSVAIVDNTLSDTDLYVYAACSNGRNMEVYAMWYE